MNAARAWLVLAVTALPTALALGCAQASPQQTTPASQNERAFAMGAACVVAGPEVCFNGWDDNCNGPIDEGCGVESGLIQFIIAWDPPEADVDLDVLDPDGTVAEVGRTTSAGLTRDRDCPGKGDCGARSFENVFLVDERRPTHGTYRVNVRLERWADLERAVNVNLSARLGQQRYATRLSLAQERDESRFSWVF